MKEKKKEKEDDGLCPLFGICDDDEKKEEEE